MGVAGGAASHPAPEREVPACVASTRIQIAQPPDTAFTIWTLTVRVALGLESVDSWAAVRTWGNEQVGAARLRLGFKTRTLGPLVRQLGLSGYAGHDPDLRRGP